MRQRLIVVVISGLFFIGCKQKVVREHIDFESGEVVRTDKDIQAPKQLIREIEKLYVKIVNESDKVRQKTEAELLISIPRKYLEIEVDLIEKTKGVLAQNTRFPMPRGGGSIDFRNYVNAEKGAFLTKIKVLKANEKESDLSNLRVYFVSHVKRRNLSHEIYGAGCGKYLDVTTFFRRHLGGERGLELNAALGRYLSVVGGTFFLVIPEKDGLHLGSVTFTDSRFPDLICL